MIKLLSGIITIFGVVLLGIQILCLLCAVEFVLKGIGISNPLLTIETLDYWIVKSLVLLVFLFAIFGMLVMLTIYFC